jgi:ketosteroid isomerase-like protein
VPQQTTLGADFARAFAERDADRLRALLHPEIDFRGMTPTRVWEATGTDAVVEVLLENWLDDSDHVDAVDGIETDTLVDRERVGYRYSVSKPDGRFVVEQQAYLSTRDGRIDWMRVVCSGFRPAP